VGTRCCHYDARVAGSQLRQDLISRDAQALLIKDDLGTGHRLSCFTRETSPCLDVRMMGERIDHGLHLILIGLHQGILIQIQIEPHCRHEPDQFLFPNLHWPANEGPGAGVERTGLDEILAPQDQAAALRPAQPLPPAKEREVGPRMREPPEAVNRRDLRSSIDNHRDSGAMRDLDAAFQRDLSWHSRRVVEVEHSSRSVCDRGLHFIVGRALLGPYLNKPPPSLADSERIANHPALLDDDFIPHSVGIGQATALLWIQSGNAGCRAQGQAGSRTARYIGGLVMGPRCDTFPDLPLQLINIDKVLRRLSHRRQDVRGHQGSPKLG